MADILPEISQLFSGKLFLKTPLNNWLGRVFIQALGRIDD